MIAIIDYGAGNIKSLQFALTKAGLESQLTNDQDTIRQSDGIILPGVGAFHDAMTALRDLGIAGTLQEEAANGKALLGICLGMQLLYDKSFEDGEWDGLKLLHGEAGRIDDSVKVPHMGWNTLAHHNKSTLLQGIPENSYVYFVHSYAIKSYNPDELISSTDYGGKVPAIVQKNNLIGMQFHPEKSGGTGLQLLQNFGGLAS
ncbi:imidazole glycerol phosphate synthase subunit HisH [Lentibacillus sp. CBA3610]|uniref:imidazole glycerol phosphate synthase subunit HisH n=1 Tax=Lentibacillus sp. CBA3610 TaxID=2518176 RepID=UPI001594FC15|nr:imidazole glycerol phosphate synthase subunit HisH [Lentibacillus sp. CBA3610]QKY71148.1 imidazole glycerol phosphate synthase subunit HisH [Lentibacillus sp. CBA3610]